MGVRIDKFKLFYAPIPKVACTSLKRMFFRIENGFAFQRFTANGQDWNIQRVYNSGLRETFNEARIKDYRRITMVRDPVRRFLSGYTNRVVFHYYADDLAIKAVVYLRKPTPNPELDEFIDLFEQYRKISDIDWHFRPMSDFIGSDPSYFHAIYDIRQMDDFVADVAQVVGQELEVERTQTGGPKIDPGDLSPKQLEKIQSLYASDYKAYSQFF